MSVIEIVRLQSTAKGTVGVLKVDKKVICYTLEPPNQLNLRNESCIPTGTYAYTQYESEKFKTRCLAIYDVYMRSYISLHPGNIVEDTQGCILVGRWLDTQKESPTQLRSSRDALDITIDHADEWGTITITENF